MISEKDKGNRSNYDIISKDGHQLLLELPPGVLLVIFLLWSHTHPSVSQSPLECAPVQSICGLQGLGPQEYSLGKVSVWGWGAGDKPRASRRPATSGFIYSMSHIHL